MIEIDYGVQYGLFHADTQEHFDAMVDAERRRLVPYLPADSSVPVLDIGCGRGYTMAAISQSGHSNVKGVDIDASQVAAARRRGLQAEKIENLVDYLQGATREFGLITMFDVLEHIPLDKQVETLQSIRRAMAANGRLLVQVPNANAIMAARWRYIDITHQCSYTEHSIRAVMMTAGFPSVVVPPLDNQQVRPSLHPMRIFTSANWLQFKRWLVRRAWREIVAVEMGEDSARHMPLGLNLIAIADVPA